MVGGRLGKALPVLICPPVLPPSHLSIYLPSSRFAAIVITIYIRNPGTTEASYHRRYNRKTGGYSTEKGSLCWEQSHCSPGIWILTFGRDTGSSNRLPQPWPPLSSPNWPWLPVSTLGNSLSLVLTRPSSTGILRRLNNFCFRPFQIGPRVFFFVPEWTGFLYSRARFFQRMVIKLDYHTDRWYTWKLFCLPLVFVLWKIRAAVVI